MFKIDLGAPTDRRRFLRYLVMLGVGGRVLLRSGDAAAAVDAALDAAAASASWPKMTYRELGRTGFQASRLVFGCGAALSRRRKDALLNTAFDAGVNVSAGQDCIRDPFYPLGTGNMFEVGNLDDPEELAAWEKGHYDALTRQLDLLRGEAWDRDAFSPF